MDILTRLHNLPPSRFHYKLLVLVGIGWLFDAMDTGLVSFVLPALGKDWALAPAQLGWIVSIAFVGMALGAVFSGWLADRFGRKTVFAGTMVVYSIATGLCALAPDLTVLLVCRFLSASAWAANCPSPCRWSANMHRRKYAAVLLYYWKAFGAWAGFRPRWCLISLFRKPAGTAHFYSAPCPCFMCRWC